MKKSFERNSGELRRLTRNVIDCKKAAFTLAEVLISLGIIGVVAAITLVPLVTNHRKMRDIAIAKKKYAEVGQIIGAIQAELGDYSNWGNIGSDSFFEQYVDKHIKFNKKKNFSGSKKIYDEAITNDHKIYMYEMVDGTILIFGAGAANSLKIHFDINGTKGPNALSKDVFSMTLNPSPTNTSPYYEFGFHAYGSGLSDTEIKNRCLSGYKNSGYKINQDYGNHLWVLSIDASENNNAHGLCTCLEYLIRNDWDYKKFPPKT